MYDVAVIGAGPAGLAAALAACRVGARVCLVEREQHPGGILRQCIHDGFGLVRYQAKLTGPEYAWRDISEAKRLNIPLFTDTFLLDIARLEGGFQLTLQSQEGVRLLQATALVAATGCRERTARQVNIHGDRPAGVFTAGTVQRLVNMQGYMPGTNAVILGSGDIGLIMARRLVLEGARVEGVYEIKPEPSGLSRNVVQCLHDFGIPLHLGQTVTHVHGSSRVEAVTVAAADEKLRPVPGTGKRVDCDLLVLSVGLIPENEILSPLGVELDKATGGPVVDHCFQASVPGLFSCGNALHVNDLVDYVSECGQAAGAAAARHALAGAARRDLLPIATRGGLQYVVPRYLDLSAGGRATIYFRSARTSEGAKVTLAAGGKPLLRKRYPVLRPPEMERLELDLSDLPSGAEQICLSLEG